MALSEHEQRLLDEMERNLYQSDADFLAADSRRGAYDYRAVTFGILIALAGLGGVIAALAANIPLLGVAGFAVIVVGILVALRRKPGTAPESGEQRRKSGGSPVMDAFEDRWERRREQRDR